MYRCSILTLLCICLFSTAQSQATSTSDTSLRVFGKVEIDSFPGSEQPWRKFLEKNLNPNVPVNNGAPCGRYLVVVQFVVNKEGRVSDVKTLTNEGYGMEAEVLRIMKKSSPWTPAIKDDKPLNTYGKQSITFTTFQDGFNIRSKIPYVLFTNTDNDLELDIRNVKTENLKVTISEGSITDNGAGAFTARVDKPGRVVITVYKKKRKKKQVGAMSFEVRDK